MKIIITGDIDKVRPVYLAEDVVRVAERLSGKSNLVGNRVARDGVVVDTYVQCSTATVVYKSINSEQDRRSDGTVIDPYGPGNGPVGAHK